METINLAYVGRGVHEELVAHVADQEGYFNDERVHVAIHDGTGWDEERLRSCATIGLGRGVLARLTDGIPWTVHSVNTNRPLFWFIGSSVVTSMTELHGRRLAVHAPHTAPGCFARIVLRRHGIDPDRDVQCVARAPGDYQMDLRRLREGSIDAAYVGSTLGPEQIAKEEGWHVLAWVGDHFQIPTVGIAADATRFPADHPALQALIRANQCALQALSDRPDLAIDYLASFLNRLTRDEVTSYYEHYIGPYYTTDGRTDIGAAQSALDTVAAELGVAPRPAGETYQFAQ